MAQRSNSAASTANSNLLRESLRTIIAILWRIEGHHRNTQASLRSMRNSLQVQEGVWDEVLQRLTEGEQRQRQEVLRRRRLRQARERRRQARERQRQARERQRQLLTQRHDRQERQRHRQLMDLLRRMPDRNNNQPFE